MHFYYKFQLTHLDIFKQLEKQTALCRPPKIRPSPEFWHFHPSCKQTHATERPAWSNFSIWTHGLEGLDTLSRPVSHQQTGWHRSGMVLCTQKGHRGLHTSSRPPQHASTDQLEAAGFLRLEKTGPQRKQHIRTNMGSRLQQVAFPLPYQRYAKQGIPKHRFGSQQGD